MSELRYYQSTDYLVAVSIWWHKVKHLIALRKSILTYRNALPLTARGSDPPLSTMSDNEVLQEQ